MRKILPVNDLQPGTQRVLDEPWTGGIGMRRLGFTTIEMIIVVVMIGIIAVIGFPKIRRALDSTNVRSTRVFVGTAVATARAAAVQRGCGAVVHFSSGAGTVWVTSCSRANPAAIDTTGGVGDPGLRSNLQPAAPPDATPVHP